MVSAISFFMARQKTKRGTLAAWALFDFANSVLISNGGLYFQQWLTTDEGFSNAWYNFALAAASVGVLISAPVLGRWGDYRQRWWEVLLITCVIMTGCSVLIPGAARF